MTWKIIKLIEDNVENLFVIWIQEGFLKEHFETMNHKGEKKKLVNLIT